MLEIQVQWPFARALWVLSVFIISFLYIFWSVRFARDPCKPSWNCFMPALDEHSSIVHEDVIAIIRTYRINIYTLQHNEFLVSLLLWMYIIPHHFQKTYKVWTLKAVYKKEICRCLRAKIKCELLANNKSVRQFWSIPYYHNLDPEGDYHQENMAVLL